MAIVNGNIVVDPSVGGGAGPNIEGLYEADGTFHSGAAATKLSVRGSVAAVTGVSLERDLTGLANSDPSEVFEYAPDQILMFPNALSVRKLNWKEVAP